MSLRIVEADLTEMDSDAIVNAANCYLRPGKGVCRDIFNKAGFHELLHACDNIGHINIGQCCITSGYNLKSRYIIHAVGPIYIDGKHQEANILRDAYLSSLDLAYKKGLHSISFPLISTDTFGYPKKEAIAIAIESIKDFLKSKDMIVNLVASDKTTFQMMQSQCL